MVAHFASIRESAVSGGREKSHTGPLHRSHTVGAFCVAGPAMLGTLSTFRNGELSRGRVGLRRDETIEGMLGPAFCRIAVGLGTLVDEYLSCKEFQRLGHEVRVELEHPTVSGIGINDQVAMRKTPRQIVRVLGWNHAITVAVGDKHRLLNL